MSDATASYKHGDWIAFEDLPGVIQRWVAGGRVKDVEAIVALYHPDIVFKGTVWNETVRTREDMHRYFTSFTEGRNDIDIRFSTLHSFELGNDAVVYGGEYQFSWIDGSGARTELEANYTFVTQGGLITVHHSSKREA